ncbi:MAG: FAD:protein FMN transferase [Cyclobacteriaceae bacterium]
MNSYQKKNIIYSIVLLSLVVLVWLYRNQQSAGTEEDAAQEFTFSGQTMGTLYNIKYVGEERPGLKAEVDSLLEVFNQSVNHYLPDSEISRFNRGDSLYFELPYFLPVLQKSKEVVDATGAAFDPTVAPLVNAWGFGPEGGELPDSVSVDSLLQLVGFDKIVFNDVYVTKTTPNVQLNFSAIAKGYGVDVVADYLSAQGIENMMVEIGGEVVCKGVNGKGDVWRIGIDNPISDGQLTAAIAIPDRAIATSGDYRNYYMKDGKKYAHTISPQTGYPVEHSVLSVSVIAQDCMTSDAYATAFMVLGLEESIEVLEKDTTLDAYIIFDDRGEIKTYQTEGLAEILLEL